MLILAENQWEIIRRDAEAAYPGEACGLLVGMGRSEVRITRVVPSPNLAAQHAHDRFEIDPEQRIRIQRALRGTSEYLVGHYHSHPDMPCDPSAIDVSLAYEPHLIWLIASVRMRYLDDLRAYKIDDGEVCELDMVIERGVD